MNVVVRGLAEKKDLQGFLLALLDDVEQYFKSTPPLTEEKLYANLNTIFNRITRDFPFVSSVSNLSKRIARDLRDKISDRCENLRERKKAPGFRSFMENIQTEQKTMKRTPSQEGIETLNVWMKKTLLQGIRQVKQDIRDAELGAAQNLLSKLKRIAPKSAKLPQIIFVDSFLSNQAILKELKESYSVKKVTLNGPASAKDEVAIADCARALLEARVCVISADAILRNGGILSRNGSLMLAVLAQQLRVPVLAVSRSYCLWEQVLCSQQSLVHQQNPIDAFTEEEESQFRVVIAKKYDYIEPKLIKGIASEENWEGKTIIEVFDGYYQ